MVDSIIFDLDGTLWDPLVTCVVAWNQVLELRKTGIVVTKQKLRSVMGRQHDQIADELFSSLIVSKREELIREINGNEIKAIQQRGGKLYPHTRNVLKMLKQANYPLLIVSNCQKGYIEAFLSYHKLTDFFLDYESSGNTGMEKAENIKLIIQRQRLPNPVYIGDTSDDQIACQKAEIPFIFARYGFGNNIESQYQISDIEDLINTNILSLVGKNSPSQ